MATLAGDAATGGSRRLAIWRKSSLWLQDIPCRASQSTAPKLEPPPSQQRAIQRPPRRPEVSSCINHRSLPESFHLQLASRLVDRRLRDGHLRGLLAREHRQPRHLRREHRTARYVVVLKLCRPHSMPCSSFHRRLRDVRHGQLRSDGLGDQELGHFG